MNTCMGTAKNCIPGRNWVRFCFHLKGYDSRPVKEQPLGPWWEDGHGLGFVSVIAYIPLQSSTTEAAESLLKEYWPNAVVNDSKVRDRILYTRIHACPSWWKGEGELISC